MSTLGCLFVDAKRKRPKWGLGNQTESTRRPTCRVWLSCFLKFNVAPCGFVSVSQESDIGIHGGTVWLTLESRGRHRLFGPCGGEGKGRAQIRPKQGLALIRVPSPKGQAPKPQVSCFLSVLRWVSCNLSGTSQDWQSGPERCARSGRGGWINLPWAVTFHHGSLFAAGTCQLFGGVVMVISCIFGFDQPPISWRRCEKSGDTQNLWLNLSDGR